MALNDILKDCLIYTDREVKIGACRSITLPKIEEIKDDMLNGGMAARVRVGMAAVEALELEYVLTGFDRQNLGLFGYRQGNNVPFTIRGAHYSEETGITQASVVHCRGRIDRLDFGTWERGTAATLTIGTQLRYYKLAFGATGQTVVHEIDAFGGTLIVDGVNLRAEINAAIGI